MQAMPCRIVAEKRTDEGAEFSIVRRDQAIDVMRHSFAETGNAGGHDRQAHAFGFRHRQTKCFAATHMARIEEKPRLLIERDQFLARLTALKHNAERFKPLGLVAEIFSGLPKDTELCLRRVRMHMGFPHLDGMRQSTLRFGSPDRIGHGPIAGGGRQKGRANTVMNDMAGAKRQKPARCSP